MGEFPEETGLAHSRLADGGDDLAVADASPLQRPAKDVKLGFASHEASEAASSSGFEPAVQRTDPEEFENLHRVRESPYRHRAERVDLNKALDQPGGVGCEQDGAGGGQLFHPRREVRGLADSRVVHVQIAADGPHDNLAGVEPHSDLKIDTVSATRLVHVSLDRLLHAESRIAGPNSVLLMGERRAEERHDPIAHHLVDRSFVTVHGLHHPLQHGIEQLAGVFGVAVSQQLHGGLQVSEEDGDLLSLALEDGLGREDPLGEVLGDIRLGRAEPRLNGAGCCRQRPATAPAELLAALVQEATRGASGSEGQPALTTEAASLTVLCVAARTDYQRSSPISVSACFSQNRMSISRYIVAAVVRCSCACSRLPVRR